MGHVRKHALSFFLTTYCNLNCIYCYAYKGLKLEKKDRILDFKFAKRGMDDFFRDYGSAHLRFYGVGEPTLEFELMKKISDYARKKATKKVTLELQSNGVFNEEIADWVKDNIDILWISCDGPKEIQNYQRPTITNKPSADIVESNIKFFSKQKHMQFGVRATITPALMENQMAIVDYFKQFDIKYINVHPAFVSVEDDREHVFVWDPIVFAENFLKTHNEAKELGIFYNSLYIANFDEKTRHACRSAIPYPQLTTDGYVSCCDFGQFGPKYSPGPLQQLVYGEYIPEQDAIIYDEDKIHKIRSRCAENLAKGPCKGCEYICHCSGGCLGQALNETGDILGMHEVNCEITKYLAQRMELNKGLHPVVHS
ncbi:MAG: Anaerobic sulfatase-maturating enzyme [Candidatus Anoxychlamydiales bacterium]|nr:Anaerobic sulfatase-maturating enzyme [Candidatus Anoxychlamydiales bacterium]